METNGTTTEAPPRIGARTWAEIHHDLRRRIRDDLIKTRVQGTAKVRYIEWTTAVRLLDHYAPGWTGRVEHVAATPQLVIVTYSITIPCSDGTVTRTATGDEVAVYTKDRDDPARFSGYGSPATNAEAQALKRAAAKLGVGFDLYLDD